MVLDCIIVEDEPMARELLKDYCQKVPSLNLVASFTNAIEALDYLRTHQVNLIFLDIRMPDLSGLDFLKILDHKPYVVFTTAFTEYAVDGFELDATDYLLKPFDFSRFMKAITKVLNQYDKSADSSPEDNHIFVKDGRDLVKIEYDEIHYIKSTKDYVTFYCSEKKVMTLMTMKALEESLPDAFLRIHQSYIINSNHIASVTSDHVLIASQQLPISQTYKQSFKRFVDNQLK